MTTSSRRAPAASSQHLAPPSSRLVQEISEHNDGGLNELENQICDLDRAARIAFLMTMHDSQNPDDESLGLFAVEHVERLAKALRESFYLASDGKVRS